MLGIPYSMRHTKCLAVIAGSNLCRGDNTNNSVLASDEMIFIGHTSSCVVTRVCHTIICPSPG